MTLTSYAQNFEDVMLRRALAGVTEGFYVDVGAQHPEIDSVTKAFSIAGWRGINIEPVKHWFDMLEQDRPHDINLNMAVSDRDGDSLDLFEVEGTGLSTTDAEFAERHRADGFTVTERRVPTITLDSVFEQNGVKEVHFLKVDCEGAEKAALASCSFESVRPWIVLVEATEPRSQVSVHDQWEYLLADRGYVRAYADGLNLFYVANEHADLIDAFRLPPNVFDNFALASEARVRDALERTHAALESARESHNVTQGELVTTREMNGQLSRSLADVTRHYDAWHAETKEHVARLEQERARYAERAERLPSVEAELSRLQADEAHFRMHVRREVAEEIAALRSRAEAREREASHLVEMLGQQDAQIRNFLASTSWRITAPVRGAKLLLSHVLRLGWRVARPLVVRLARALRPLFRRLLRVPAIRRFGGALLGPQTRLGRRARMFLGGGVTMQPVDAFGGPTAMTEDAVAVEARLRAAINRRPKT
ncbi:MAG TPA: FkbM family methyltransferase [Luteibacter sp.]|jgi:FkbM family methyltransferase|uniref:FkbM family methyltransferase n=1 Tax=Luteibacter sp. TaxID=1886636 RepID=UPI002F3EB5E4